jgi:hypothetical protein
VTPPNNERDHRDDDDIVLVASLFFALLGHFQWHPLSPCFTQNSLRMPSAQKSLEKMCRMNKPPT